MKARGSRQNLEAGFATRPHRRRPRQSRPGLLATRGRLDPRRPSRIDLPAVTDGRRDLLQAVLGFLTLEPREPEFRLLHRCFDTWRGIGDVVAGMARQVGACPCRASRQFIRLPDHRRLGRASPRADLARCAAGPHDGSAGAHRASADPTLGAELAIRAYWGVDLARIGRSAGLPRRQHPARSRHISPRPRRSHRE